MPMVIVGVLLLLAKIAGWAPVAGWSWWIILAPFAAAAAWWHFADASGLTKQREMDKMERRKIERREKAMQSLGLGTGRGPGTARPGDPDRPRPRPVGDPTQQARPGADARPPAVDDRREPRL